MKNKVRVKQISALVAVVVISAFLLFASALTTEEVLASSVETGGFAGFLSCVVVAPIMCVAWCGACFLDECTYCITCGACDSGCFLGCVEDCGACVDNCMACVGCAEF